MTSVFFYLSNILVQFSAGLITGCAETYLGSAGTDEHCRHIVTIIYFTLPIIMIMIITINFQISGPGLEIQSQRLFNNYMTLRNDFKITDTQNYKIPESLPLSVIQKT